MDAVSWVLETREVVMATSFHITVLPLTKLVPLAVIVNGEVMPLGEVFGVMDVRVGAGTELPVTVSGKVLVVVLSGLVTLTPIVAAEVTGEAAMVA
jgi:hypothetical protein